MYPTWLRLEKASSRLTCVCRSASSELQQIEGVRIIADIDVTDADALTQLAGQLAHQALDVVINNAGVLHDESLQGLDAATIRHQFEVNALAPLLLTKALLPNLRHGSKLVLITSRMGSIGDNGSGGMYGYRMSKAALNAAGKSLAVDLKGAGIAVGILHPGLVATDMGGPQGIPPTESATNLIARIDQLSLASSGEFWHANGTPLPW